MTVFSKIIQDILQRKLKLKIDSCPIEPLTGHNTEKVWMSILEIPDRNPHRKGSIRYLMFEAKVFCANRWKHRIVYPNESFEWLFIRYAWGYLKHKITINC
jgi:hypothetical protein